MFVIHSFKKNCSASNYYFVNVHKKVKILKTILFFFTLQTKDNIEMLYVLSIKKKDQLQNVIVSKSKIKSCFWPISRSTISSVCTLPLWRASMTCIKQRRRALTRRPWSARPGSSVRRLQTS